MGWTGHLWQESSLSEEELAMCPAKGRRMLITITITTAGSGRLLLVRHRYPDVDVSEDSAVVYLDINKNGIACNQTKTRAPTM